MIKPQEINLNDLPCVPLNKKKELPTVAGIYFAIDAQGKVQYIGRTKNLKNRWTRHHRESQLNELTNIKIAYLEISEISLLSEIERALIKWFKPFLNRKVIKPKKPFISKVDGGRARNERGQFANSSRYSEKIISVRLYKDDEVKLLKKSEELGLTPAQIARIAIAEWLEQN